MWGVIPIVKSNNLTEDSSESNYSPFHMIKDYNINVEDISEDGHQIPVHDDSQNHTDNNFTFGTPIKNPSTLNDRDLLKIGMNVCHSLTILDNQLTGDPLDVKVKQFSFLK